MSREQALIKLYEQCLEKNFTDMTNQTHQLKAKVFATDLGLKYSHIAELFAEAKIAYDKNQAELAKKQQQIKQRQEANARREEMRKTAKLAFTVKDTYRTLIDFYRCEDGSVYCEERGVYKTGTYYNITVDVIASSLMSYKYHPGKIYYTGASVGGVSMGGFHTTEAHYTTSSQNTGNGSIKIKYGTTSCDVESVTIEPEMAKLFRRVPAFKSNFLNNEAICRRHSNMTDTLFNAAMNTSDFGRQMELTGIALDETKIPYKKCAEIADVLNSIIHNNLPAQDEEIYTKAIELSKTKDIEHLGEAVKMFEYIKDYKDAEKYLSEIRPVYEDLVQTKKEQAIIQKEAKQKKKKIIGIVSLVVVLVTAVTAVVLYSFITKEQNYQAALRQLDLGYYDDAIGKFRKLNNYKDSAELVKESRYQKIWYEMETDMDTVEKAVYIAEDFQQLGDYKDSQEIAEQLFADADRYYELIGVAEITRDEIERAKQIIEENKYLTVTESYQAQIYAFDMLHDIEWEYLSGDPYAVSMATENKREIRNLNTFLYNLEQWQSTSLKLYQGEESLYPIGVIKGSIYTNKYKEQTIYYKETAFSGHDVSAAFDGSNDTLTITVEKSDGNTYTCTYKKVQ